MLLNVFQKSYCILLIAIAIQMASVQAETVADTFQKHDVVPDVIPTSPNQFLEIIYDGNLSVQPGAELTPTQVKSQPLVKWQSEPGSYYTLIMTDPDAPSRTEPKFREFKHWLLANIPGNEIAQGETIAAYVGSGPPKGTGLHRYVFLLYKQPSKLQFDEPHVSNTSRDGRPKFRAADFAEKYNLGTPIAGNFYQAQYDDYVPTVHKQLSG